MFGASVDLCKLTATAVGSLRAIAAGGVAARGPKGETLSKGDPPERGTNAGPEDRAGALATFFMAGYVGVSLPVLGIGLALHYFTPRVTLLAFGLAVAVATLAAAPHLLRQESTR